jgi:hypothetical protein
LGDEGALVRGGGIIKVGGADKGVAGEYDRGAEDIGGSARDIGELGVLGPSGTRAFKDINGALIIEGSDDLREVIAWCADEECIAEERDGGAEIIPSKSICSKNFSLLCPSRAVGGEEINSALVSPAWFIFVFSANSEGIT